MKQIITFLIYLVVYVAVVMVLLWTLDYLDAPRIFHKVFVVIAVLGGLLGAIRYFWTGDKPLT